MDAEHTTTPPLDGGPPRPIPFYREHALLAGSVAALFGVVGAMMALSLVSCETSPPAGDAVAPGATAREDAETLAHLPRASLANISSEPEVRVRLAAGVPQAELSGYVVTAGSKGKAGPVYLGPIGGHAGPMQFPGPLRVSMTPEGWLLTDGAGKSLRLEAPGELVVTADPADWTMSEGVPAAEQATGAPGPMVAVTVPGSNGGAGSPYPGRVWLAPRTETGSASFDVIEHVGLEKYLVGVVVKEMYQNWPREAFKVQAVCARTYALHERTRGQQTRRSYDVEGSTRDQAYAGATSNRNAIEAVNSTRGVVLACAGELLRAYYSSTCGGRTASARSTWPITRGYEYNLAEPIQAHTRECLCQDSPLYAWTVTRSADDLTRRIRAFGEANQQMVRQLSGIHSLDVLESEPTGRPSVYKLVEPGPGGAPGKWYRIRAEDLRVACNTSAPGLPPVTSKDRVNSGDLVFKVTPPAPQLKLTDRQRLTTTRVEISGRGFGHGVGMCQYCARAMALRGDGWQKMLGVFYPGADIVKAYR